MCASLEWRSKASDKGKGSTPDGEDWVKEKDNGKSTGREKVRGGWLHAANCWTTGDTMNSSGGFC